MTRVRGAVRSWVPWRRPKPPIVSCSRRICQIVSVHCAQPEVECELKTRLLILLAVLDLFLQTCHECSDGGGLLGAHLDVERRLRLVAQLQLRETSVGVPQRGRVDVTVGLYPPVKYGSQAQPFAG